LKLNVLATDSFRDAAYDTFLYYNPHATDKSVAIDLGYSQLYDLYDAAANRFITRGATGQTFFSVPADDAVMLVAIPAGGRQTFDGRRMLVNDVVVDYNAALLPGNLVRNADVDVASASSGARPGFWHGSANAEWSTETAVSPSHSLKLDDHDPLRTEEWRSFANAIPADNDRVLSLRWFWNYDATDEFHARLRLSDSEVTGVDLTDAVATYNIVISGNSDGFELFEMNIPLPDDVRSFDLTFVTGSFAGAMGTMFIDDVSASILPESAYRMIESDFNGDGVVDAFDLDVWKRGFGSNFSGKDFLAWQRNAMHAAGGIQNQAEANRQSIPEPSAAILAGIVLAVYMRPGFARSAGPRK
jgi:hypothetical protein